MKRVCKFFVISSAFYDSPDLSLQAKWVAIAIDSYSDTASGVAIGVKALQTATNLSAKEVKDALSELREHGALDVTIDNNGTKLLKAHLWKPAYPKTNSAPSIGDVPREVEQIDFALIQQTWNSVCLRLPSVDRLTARRKQKIRTCLKGASASQADLIKVIHLVSVSKFLNGLKKDSWRCTFDWVIKSPDNFTKIIEGHYHKDATERNDYDAIMRGEDVTPKQDSSNDYYR